MPNAFAASLLVRYIRHTRRNWSKEAGRQSIADLFFYFTANTLFVSSITAQA